MQENYKSLVTEVLKFYGNPERYKGDPSSIDNDGGHMARHTIELIASIDNQMNDFEKQYEESQKKVQELSSETATEQIEAIRKLSEILSNGR